MKSEAYALVAYTVKGKLIRSLESIPRYLSIKEKNDPKLQDYLQKSLQQEYKKGTVENLSVRLYPVRQRSLLKLDGYYYHIGGGTGKMFYLIDAVPMYFSSDDSAYVKKIEKANERQQYDEIEKDTGKMVITKERNLKLYDLLISKLSTGIYTKRKASILEILVNGREQFQVLDISDQCTILLRILIWKNTARKNVDLKLVGGSANSGLLTASRKLSNNDEAILIEQSTTGLYERPIDLRTI